MGKFTFTREERLNKETWIKALFERGNAFKIYPFRVLHLRHPEPRYPFNQVLISVSIRNFKRAVDRNLIKRRIREAYRLRKDVFQSDQKLLIALIYNSRAIEPFDKIKESVLKIFESIRKSNGSRKNDEN
jgi:ribonuclease P protein component